MAYQWPDRSGVDQASGKQWGIRAAKVYDDHDINTIRENDKSNKIKVFKLPEGERQRFIKKLMVMEGDWADEMSKKGLPAREILEAVHESANKNR